MKTKSQSPGWCWQFRNELIVQIHNRNSVFRELQKQFAFGLCYPVNRAADTFHVGWSNARDQTNLRPRHFGEIRNFTQVIHPHLDHKGFGLVVEARKSE